MEVGEIFYNKHKEEYNIYGEIWWGNYNYLHTCLIRVSLPGGLSPS